ncbi:MAG TPA: hypothetical protein VFT34_04455 [Verrucomicrobiae bacterium]|nr:hypothetical protein [Verrucomicrobiae bacterium]
MTENPAPKPKFARRGVILGAAGLALVLAVALVGFGPFDGNSRGSVKATFVGFEKSADNNSFRAVLCVTNETELEFVILDTDSDGGVLGRFHSPRGNDEGLLGIGTMAEVGWPPANLMPHAARVVKIPLPNHGHAGRVEVCLGTKRIMPSGRLGRLREWARYRLPLRKKLPQAVCDQEIQCPRVLPDGTVEPPRLLSATEAKL